MISTSSRRPDRPDRGASSHRGYSLIETMVALVIASVLVAMGIPRFQTSLEKARADVAGANLRAIWSAQRLYWLESPSRSYAADLPTLHTANLIDPSLAAATAPYTYQVTVLADGTFTATATRSGTSSWTGSFTIAADGSFSGSIQQAGGGATISPDFQ
jgi:prepilin-type N-terminal cleavage/methylation domain-containing protein